MDLIYWDHYYDTILLVNLLIVIVLFTSLRLFSGTLSGIRATRELLIKDNPAFGISLAGTMLGVTIMLTGFLYGEPEQSVAESALTVAINGGIGILLLALARLILDKVTLNAVSIRNQIVNGNVAVAIVDASNIIATAIILRAVIVWIKSNSVQGIVALLLGYAISQTVLTFATLLKLKIADLRNKDTDIQSEFKRGNVALALRFSGQKIGTAFAIAIASKLVATEVYDIAPILSAWFFASIGVIIILKIISYVSEHIVLYKVDFKHEVVTQRNVAVGAIQAVIYISIGLLVSGI